MLNSIGFQNIGVSRLLHDVAPVWETWDTPVVVNMFGDTVGEFARLAEALDGAPGVAGVEVNVSCPNLDVGGIEFGRDPAAAAAVTEAVRGSTSLPVIVKLTPGVTDIAAIACAVEQAGADALCVANSFVGMAIDVQKRRPRTNRTVAGLTGPAIKPLALRLTWEAARAVEIPVIGCGGIVDGARRHRVPARRRIGSADRHGDVPRPLGGRPRGRRDRSMVRPRRRARAVGDCGSVAGGLSARACSVGLNGV